MSDYERTIAKCDEAWIGREDHGILTAHVSFDYGDGGHQGIPGFALDGYDKETKRRVGSAKGIEFIAAIMGAFGANRFDKIIGRTVFALHKKSESIYILGLEPLPTEKGERVIFEDVWK